MTITPNSSASSDDHADEPDRELVRRLARAFLIEDPEHDLDDDDYHRVLRVLGRLRLAERERDEAKRHVAEARAHTDQLSDWYDESQAELKRERWRNRVITEALAKIGKAEGYDLDPVWATAKHYPEQTEDLDEIFAAIDGDTRE